MRTSINMDYSLEKRKTPIKVLGRGDVKSSPVREQIKEQMREQIKETKDNIRDKESKETKETKDVKSPIKSSPDKFKSAGSKSPPFSKSLQQNIPNSTNTQNIPNTQTESKTNPREYTEQEIHNLLSDGYIVIHPSLWDYIPNGSHIRYVKKGDGSRSTRFRPGGFVKSHFTTSDDKKMMMIESRVGGKPGDAGYISFPIAYTDIEELWKKYDRYAFIEIHLIYSSLAQKKQQIEDLTTRVNRLESILMGLVQK